jgi:hypothetical protein
MTTMNENAPSLPDPARMCGRCYDEADLVPPTCRERPELTHGAVGMYHCPDCGAMLLAGFEHPRVCQPCATRSHPRFDATEPIA